jgi:Tol biopolymer transport system component
LFSTRSFDRILKVDSAGGTPETLVTADSAKAEEVMLPHALPGGKAILFTTRSSLEWDTARVVLYIPKTGERRVLIDGAADARYVRTGHLVYIKKGTLMAVPFDLGTLQVTGAPVALVDGVMQAVNMGSSNVGDTNQETGVGQFVISDSGTLLYLTGGITPNRDSSLVWADRKGVAQALAGMPVRVQNMPRLSPDKTKVAVSGGGNNLSADILVYDTAHGSLTRLTFKGTNWWPIWSPDGKRLVYASNVSGHFNLYMVNASDAGQTERLTTSDYDQFPSSWTAAGNLVAFLQQQSRDRNQIGVLPVDGDRKTRVFLESKEPRFGLGFPEFSPDGRWMAYYSNESGRGAIYVRPYPGPGESYRVSEDGTHSPIWAANGRELLYKTKGGGFASVAITSLDPFRWNPPRSIFDYNPGEYSDTSIVRDWDISPDAQRFLLVRPEESKDKPVTEIQIVLNWTEELKRRAPAK